ncbi:MAG TPA: lytic transglycosylase domain-containing protein [Mycobacteriales bacterium]|nr:lytic transglycosylase domain-containing protein [Mycobacteriales bacterium]
MAVTRGRSTVGIAVATAAVLLTAGGVTVADAVGPDRPAAVGIATPAPLRASAAGRAASAAVPPLRHLAAPDVVVTLPQAAAPARVDRLRRQRGIGPVAVLDTGQVQLRGRRLPAIGAAPGQLRGFTPVLTARSDPLWLSVARGDLTLAYGTPHALRRDLGRTLTARARRALPVRIGAFASVGIGHAQAVVDHRTAKLLGLRPARRLVIAAPHLSIAAIAARVHRVFGHRARVHGTRPHTGHAAAVSAYAQATIPAGYLALYRAAATTCPGLPWTVLAGIGAVETGHGTNVHRSSKGAVGPMQFLPSTFAGYGIDGNGDGVADIHDPADAVYSAARYLCLWGAGRGGQALYDAVFAYNHADWYVREVFAYANAYA